MQANEFKTIPKIELHLHLDCSLSFKVVQKIDENIDFDEYQSSFQASSNCSSLKDYISCADRAIALMQTKENLELVVEDLFEQLYDDNVIYAEIRFAPLLHCEKNLNAKEVIEIICNSSLLNSRKYNIDYGLILCTLRHYTESESLQTVKLVKEFFHKGVVGFDIAADEAGYPIDKHIKAFNYAKNNNLNVTAHAGEAKGPESIWETINEFHTKRIGHGVRCVEDKKLVSYLAENNYHLEICLTSNIKTNTFDTYDDHPLNEIFDSSISLSINTDGRAISKIDLSKEYEILYDKFNWSIEKILKCNLNAIEHSFTSKKIKEKLRRLIAISS